MTAAKLKKSRMEALKEKVQSPKTARCSKAAIILPSQEDIDLLRCIAELEAERATLSAKLRRFDTSIKSKMQEAIDKKITVAGNLKLVCKARTTKKIDMAAVEKMLTKEQFLLVAHVSLKDASQYLTQKQIDSVSTKEISTSYKVELVTQKEE